MKELIALTKPGVTRMCLLTTLGGFMLAPVELSWPACISAMLGTAACVGGANAFNMWLERDADARMSRTRRRPLPAGRLHPDRAVQFAWLLAIVGVAVLALGTNILTAVLGALAIASYVLVYTPLKYRTPLALVIGAVPGAAPPLLGWTAAMNSIDAPALVLFAILLVWQLPHFLAIALYRQDDYAKAGIKVVPLVRGVPIAKIQAVAWSMVLVPLSLLLVPLGVAGDTYMFVAFLLGSAFLGWAFTGLDDRAGVRWARGFFLASLVYLPVLTIALVLDVVA
ncbi:MAG TPA: heme o synthase [Nannocystaceae bacterium]|nr:heme o synthase [Nannocystaceae bacterium]